MTQAAVSHQVKRLEERLGSPLFRRLPRGLALTDEGLALVPVVSDSFARIGDMLDRFADGRFREVLTVGVVGTFAVGWLLPRLPGFHEAHPEIDLRLLTNNNRVDLAGEGLDFAIRFGDGAWHGTEADQLVAAPFVPLCSPRIGTRIASPADLGRESLLRSYRQDEWPRWFEAAGVTEPAIRGPVFDSSLTMALAAEAGAGVALLPADMFARQLGEGSLIRPLPIEVDLGSYWLTRLKTRPLTHAMKQFQKWLSTRAD